MKKIIISLIPLLVAFISCTNNNDTRPNVIIILTDDQGSIDVNAYGATDLATPSLDKLASEGVMFTRFYVGSAICSPSRATILTGLTPHSAGVPGNVSSIPGNPGMPSENLTIAEILKDKGYATGHIGKWHLGYSKETSPLAQGFDYSFGHMGGCIDNYSHFFYWNGPNRHDLWENGEEVFAEGQYFPDLMADKAESFIKKNRNKPFLLYYAINTPHYPLQPREGWRDYYKDMEMPRRDYAGFVSTADENIGYITDLLNRLRIKENTIIIYLSDHGHSYEVRAFGGGGSSGPYRGGKTSLFEGGIRVPAIISWPGKIPQNEIRNQVSHSIDLVPTILSLCSIDDRPYKVEGIDLSSAIIVNSKLQERSLFWKLGSQWAIRSGDWKLIGLPNDPSKRGILDPEEDRLFLSNVAKDSSEMINLASDNPDIVETLIEEYLKWNNADKSDIPDDITTVENRASTAKVKLGKNAAAQYSGSGPKSLVDGKLGTRSHSDGFWLGFEAADMQATLDLGEVQLLNNISVRFLNSPENWIFYPVSVTISFSKDGITFDNPFQMETKISNIRKSGIYTSTLEDKKSARYIRVIAKNIDRNPEWHSNPGGKSWLFCDEIIIK